MILQPQLIILHITSILIDLITIYYLRKYFNIRVSLVIFYIFIFFLLIFTITFSQIVNIMFAFLFSALLEELDFLHEVCLTALFSNRVVKFAAVLDNNGKLIVGEYRKCIQSSWRADFISDNKYHQDASYLFYLDYVLPAIKKRLCYAGYLKEEQHRQQQEINFELTKVDDNVRLAMAPLTERNDKYLCIYLESSAHYQETISILRNAII